MESDGIRKLSSASGSACGDSQIRWRHQAAGYPDGGLFLVTQQIAMASGRLRLCADGGQAGAGATAEADVKFTFLGFAFRPCVSRNSRGIIYTGFLPAVSPQALERMRERIRSIGLPSLVYLSLEEIATLLHPVLRGWMQYYGRFYRTELIRKFYRYLDDRIAAWLRQRYKRLRGRRLRSWRLLVRIRSGHRYLFAHWRRAGEVVSG